MTNVEVRYPIILYFKMARATRFNTSAFEIPCSIFDILFFISLIAKFQQNDLGRTHELY